MKIYTDIVYLLFLMAASLAFAQEPAATSQAAGAADSAKVAGIVFNGVVQDSSFAAGEKLNVEILESGEALQTIGVVAIDPTGRCAAMTMDESWF